MTTSPAQNPVRQLGVVVEVPDYHDALRFCRDALGMPEQAAFAEGASQHDRMAVLASGAVATVPMVARYRC